MRVKLTAVKTDVTMPIIRTTAKPRTGPEPKYHIKTAAMTLVMFASKMAESVIEGRDRKQSIDAESAREAADEAAANETDPRRAARPQRRPRETAPANA